MEIRLTHCRLAAIRKGMLNEGGANGRVAIVCLTFHLGDGSDKTRN